MRIEFCWMTLMTNFLTCSPSLGIKTTERKGADLFQTILVEHYICTVHSVHKAFLIRSHSDGTRTLPFVSSKRMCLSKTFQGCICNEVRGKVLRKMDMKKTGWHPDHCNLQRQASQKSSSSLEQDFQVNCFRHRTRRRIQ